MEIFAYYLPQFHEIPENNEWWGKGFTEWVNVKKAQPLYRGHNQPRIPLNDNYYCLLDKQTLLWQDDLLRHYKVDGLIFYHYYFKGKKLLEKPAELLLQNNDIPINFFFCWANHDWNRAWKNSRKLLIKQEYGNEQDWEGHFNYLLPFFKDLRYKKIDGKPLLMVFKSDFAEKNKMFEFLNNKCVQAGFAGIYFMETYNGIASFASFTTGLSPLTKAIVRREPDCSLNILRRERSFIKKVADRLRRNLCNACFKSLIKKYNGNDIIKIMNERDCGDVNVKIIRGLYFEWDNTSRHGKRGYIIKPYSKDAFFKYMETVKNDDMIFCNAWNEWCEGMYMEPDTKNGYKYLEWIKEWKDKQGE